MLHTSVCCSKKDVGARSCLRLRLINHPRNAQRVQNSKNKEHRNEEEKPSKADTKRSGDDTDPALALTLHDKTIMKSSQC